MAGGSRARRCPAACVWVGRPAAGASAIWLWRGRDLMASMTRDFTSEVRQHVSAGKERVAEQVTLAFQNKAVKYLEGTLAAGRGAEQARAQLTGYSGSPATT